MDYRKIDAALAATLSEADDPDERLLAVFIHTIRAPTPAEALVLERHGTRGPTSGRQVFTATLSPRAVEEISKQPWVRAIKLSHKLRLLRGA